MKVLDYDGLEYYNDLIETKYAPLSSPALTGTPTAPTPTAGDDSTRVATTAFVQDEIDTEVTRADGAYLPLSGGTMTGAITAGTAQIVSRSVNNSYTQINGGTATSNGASLLLFGKDESRDGAFRLQANDGTNTKMLEGNADGTLTWAGTLKFTSAFSVGKTTDDGILGLYSGTALGNGAGISLSGKNASSNAGRFLIYARNSSASKALEGKPDGSLTWNSKSIVTSDNLVVETKTGSAVSVNAGAVYSNATVNVALSGYTPLGVVGWEVTGTNSSYAMIFKVSLSGTTVSISGRNMASSAASWTPKVNVLYVKN